MSATALRNILRVFFGDRRGNVAIFAAVAMPVLVGSMGLGAEVASWYGGKRALQNAADSAAISAATNATANDYDDEARAVAAQYGLKNGVDGVTVTASNTAPCPGGGSNCYSVTISRVQPLFLAQVVGFHGDLTVDGAPAKRLSATAVAVQANAPREYCIVALAASGAPKAIHANGVPFANLSGCNIMSNTDAECNGHNLGAEVGDAHGVNSGCGKISNSNVPSLTDPYASLASKIPSNPCSSYHDAPKKKNDPPLPTSNVLHGLEARDLIQVCGDTQLSGPVLVSSNTHTLLVVYNGSLDLQGYMLQTMPGSTLTIIFAGDDNNRMHAPIGDGTFDIQAPTTGDWKGVAMYQKPSLTGGVNISAAGNEPTWNITGLAYLPHASVTLSGAVSKSSNGAACFAMMVDNLTLNGTGAILSHGECPQAGLTLPYTEMPSRGKLVS